MPSRVIMRWVLLPACAVACALAAAHGSLATARAEQVRALWVACTTLTSPLAIARMVQSARSSGFNTLLVQVRARRLGTAGVILLSYDSLVGSSPNGDPLSQIGHAVFQD